MVGTVVAASESVATLQVDAQWQGAPLSPTITIDNHVYRLASPSCATRRAEGQHVAVGNRFVAFLNPTTDGPAAWRFGGGFADAFIVVDNTDHDRRFFQPNSTVPARQDPPPEPGSRWFLHGNLGYAESSTVATIKVEWQVKAPMRLLGVAIQDLAQRSLAVPWDAVLRR